MFEPLVIIDNLSGGIRTDDFFDNISDNESPKLIGVDLERTKPVKTSGFSLFGTDSDSSIVYKKAFNHRILSNEEVFLKFGSKVKFYDEVSGAFQIFSSQTFDATARWWAVTFNGYLFCGNPVDGFFRWRASSWSTLANPVTAASTTIDLASGTGSRYATSGNGLIDGDTFAWTGRTGDQLTGVSGLSTSHAAGARVIEEMDTTTYSLNKKSSIGVFFENRIFIVDADNPNFIYFSTLADNTTPQDDLADFATLSGAGAAGWVILDAPVLGLQKFYSAGNSPVLIAFAANGESYNVSVTDSGSTTVPTNPPFKHFSADLINENLVTRTENSFIFVDNNNNIRSASYGEQNTVLNTVRISDIIEPDLKDMDFTSGFLKYIDRRLILHGKETSAAGANNYTVVKDTNPDAYTYYDHWALNDIIEWKNNFYGISSQTGETFKLFDGDDAAGEQYYMNMSTKGITFGNAMVLKTLNRVRIFGYITANGEIEVRLFTDKDTEAFKKFTISGSNTNIVDEASGVAIGSVVLGTGVFGGGNPDPSKFVSFVADLIVPPDRYFFTLRVEIVNDDKNVGFKYDKMMLYAEDQGPHLMYTNNNLSPQ